VTRIVKLLIEFSINQISKKWSLSAFSARLAFCESETIPTTTRSAWENRLRHVRGVVVISCLLDQR